jgi:DNA-binding MarR family transcriptional regulator
MAPAGIRITQFSVLRTLSQSGPMRISELAAAQLLDRTGLSRNLDPLLQRRLVQVVHGRDARTREVGLTAAGRATLRAAIPHWRAAQAAVAQRVSKSKLDALIAVLGEIESLHPDRQAAAD